MKAYVFSEKIFEQEIGTEMMKMYEKIWIIFMALVFVTDIALMFQHFSQAIAVEIVQNAELEMFF